MPIRPRAAKPHPGLYPRCDGADPPPPRDRSPAARRKRALLDAYHRINLCYRELAGIRRSRHRQPAREQAALRALEQAILVRDGLEDEFAPHGLVSTPVVKNGVITNVVFTLPQSPGKGSLAGSMEMHFALPRPGSA